jgi:murein L,D-transpeptidase YcbB/YkuD
MVARSRLKPSRTPSSSSTTNTVCSSFILRFSCSRRQRKPEGRPALFVIPEVDPATVDWQDYHADWFPLRLRQDPGPGNALGRIKFMFPNEFAVYLHDTPERAHFNRVQRDLSSGCIRVESPVALADFVLAADGRWTAEMLTEVIEKGETRTISLISPVPVHLLYMTAWTDALDVLHFRRDIYHRDGQLAWALDQRRLSKMPDFIGLVEYPEMASGPGRPAENR